MQNKNISPHKHTVQYVGASIIQYLAEDGKKAGKVLYLQSLKESSLWIER
jgi:hypothetical protein